jgi:hypothetical protein
MPRIVRSFMDGVRASKADYVQQYTAQDGCKHSAAHGVCSRRSGRALARGGISKLSGHRHTSDQSLRRPL